MEESCQLSAISCQLSAVSLNQKPNQSMSAPGREKIQSARGKAGPACRACCRRRQVPSIRGTKAAISGQQKAISYQLSAVSLNQQIQSVDVCAVRWRGAKEKAVSLKLTAVRKLQETLNRRPRRDLPGASGYRIRALRLTFQTHSPQARAVTSFLHTPSTEPQAAVSAVRYGGRLQIRLTPAP